MARSIRCKMLKLCVVTRRLEDQQLNLPNIFLTLTLKGFWDNNCLFLSSDRILQLFMGVGTKHGIEHISLLTQLLLFRIFTRIVRNWFFNKLKYLNAKYFRELLTDVNLNGFFLICFSHV